MGFKLPKAATVTSGTKGTDAQNPYFYPVDKNCQMTAIDHGVDWAGPGSIYAIGNAKYIGQGQGANGWGGHAQGGTGDGILYKLTDGPRAGKYIYVYEGLKSLVSGGTITAGQKIGVIDGASIEMGFADASGAPTNEYGSDGGQDPHGHDFVHGKDGSPSGAAFLEFVNSIKDNTVTGDGAAAPGAGGGGGGGSSATDPTAVSRAGALSNSFELPGIMNYAESSVLTGDKALMNDTPLFEFIKSLCASSLRDFQSLPNGTFFGFFPDRFGTYNARKPYWKIFDIEIIDGKIDLSDETLFTHVYSVGDIINPDGETDMFDKINSRGTITIFDALSAGLIKGKVGNDEEALAFLKRYGARPYLIEGGPLVHNYIFEILLGITEFQKAWASQFATVFTFTFMPELFPGGIVEFPDHDLQCYVESVVHEFDYESGFNTQAEMSSPASITGDSDYSTGMIAGS